MKLGFIGTGNMAGAIMGGIIKEGSFMHLRLQRLKILSGRGRLLLQLLQAKHLHGWKSSLGKR